MSNQTPEARLLAEERIIASANRLVQFFAADAPDLLICTEIALLVKKATLAYGPMVWTELGRAMEHPVSDYYGVCRECGIGIESDVYCGTCAAEIDEIDQEEPR